jgi:hypothetical protein
MAKDEHSRLRHCSSSKRVDEPEHALLILLLRALLLEEKLANHVTWFEEQLDLREAAE